MEDRELDDVVDRSSEHDEEMLARIRGLREELAEERRQRPPVDPLTAAELAVIDELTGAPDAPAGFKLLRSRVEAGATTWDDVVENIHEHRPAARPLVLAMMKRLYSREALQPALDNLAAISAEVEKDPERFWQRVERQQAEREGQEAAVAPDSGAAPAPRRSGTLGGPARGLWSPGDHRRGDGSGAGSRG